MLDLKHLLKLASVVDPAVFHLLEFCSVGATHMVKNPTSLGVNWLFMLSDDLGLIFESSK